jgi:ribosomal protein S18 acetylase RimI-like enzyme
VPETVELVPEADDADIDAVYRTAFAQEPGAINAGFREHQLPTHRARDGFRLVGAAREGRLVGFVYGYTGNRGQFWTDHVVARAPEELVATWVGGHLEVVELAVLPEARGLGIGAALMGAVVEDRPEPCALLGTWQHPSPARRLYERLGWLELMHDLDGEYSLYGRVLR